MERLPTLKQLQDGRCPHAVFSIKQGGTLFIVLTVKQFPFLQTNTALLTGPGTCKTLWFNMFHRFVFNWLDLNVDYELNHNFLNLKFKAQASSVFIKT